MKRKHGLTPIQRIERRRFTTASGCWETDYTPNKPYPSIKVEGQHRMVHRLTYEALVGPIPEGLWVLHQCDNPRCHNPDHLFLGDRQDNVDDMMAKGRHVVTSTPTHDHDAILALAHLSQAEIARQVGCSQATVSRVLRAAGKGRSRHTAFGKARKGEDHGRAKLTEDEAKAIRNSTERTPDLASRYNVSPSTIYAIRTRKLWRSAK